jgi:putative ABC transport system permease protein
MAMDNGTAEREGFEVGDRVEVATDQPAREFELVGLAKFGTQSSIGGATFSIFDLPTAQVLFGKEGKVDTIYVAARSGASISLLTREIGALLPPTAQARTASEEADQELSDLRDELSFLTTGLLVFGFIAVLVGAFLIFNTFSITVAQRTSEIALLRMLGASRRQVLASILLEALVLGTLASALGLMAGFGFAGAINALLSALGLDLPTTDAVFKSRTAIVGMSVGVIVCMLGTLAPAIRATRVTPLEALRRSAVPQHRRRKLAALVGGILFALLGAGLMIGGLASEGADAQAKLASAAGGALALVLGIALLSPRLVPSVARVAGLPLERSTALVGRLARENSVRNPGRTAVTSGALMVGLALVVFVTILAAGLRTNIEDLLEQRFAGDIAVFHEDGFSLIPAGAADAMARVPGIETVSSIPSGDARLSGFDGSQFINGLDPETIRDVYSFDWKEGSDQAVDGLGTDGILIEETPAAAEDVKIGDSITITSAGGETRDFRVRGIYTDDGLLAPFSVSVAGFRKLYPEERRVGVILAKRQEGTDPDQVKKAVDQALAEFPEARARSQEELKKETGDQINQLLGLFYALLAMSLIIAMVGVVNTLTLSIFERTRELGLLRAVGMTQREVRRMVRYESAITAAIGALLGLGLGIFFGWVVTLALEDEGIGFSLPAGQLVVLVAISVLVGVLAAVLPARRAAKLDVLKAIAYE